MGNDKRFKKTENDGDRKRRIDLGDGDDDDGVGGGWGVVTEMSERWWVAERTAWKQRR